MTTIAAIGSTGYNIVLLLHIVTAVVAFAPAFMTFAVSRAAVTDRGAAGPLVVGIERLAIPSMIITGVLGFGLAGMSDKVYKVSQTWLSVAAVAWVLLVVVAVLVVRPAAKALAAGTEGARQKLMMGTGITHALFLLTIVMMVFKPGT